MVFETISFASPGRLDLERVLKSFVQQKIHWQKNKILAIGKIGL